MRRTARVWITAAVLTTGGVLGGCGAEAADAPDVVADTRADATAEVKAEDAAEEASADTAAEVDADPVSACPAPRFDAPGLFVAGVTTLEVNGNPVEVWYPARPEDAAGLTPESYDIRDWLPPEASRLIPDEDTPLQATTAYRDLPLAPGDVRFPIVLFSHGLAGYRSQSTFLTAHLATWGFVVAAPEHPERGLAHIVGGGLPEDHAPEQLRAALAFLTSADTADGGFFEGRLDLERVAVTGHSAGGRAASIVSADDGIDAWVALGSSGFAPGGERPVLVVGGTTDELSTPADTLADYQALVGEPRTYVSITGAGHLAFSDICLIGRERGGALQIARDHGVEVPLIISVLAVDGCRETDLPAELSFPLTNHLVTAHLRRHLAPGDEALAASLAPDAGACFPGLVGDWRVD